MDEFGAIVKAALNEPTLDLGPMEEMQALKQRLQCKPFSWFLQNVYPGLPPSLTSFAFYFFSAALVAGWLAASIFFKY